MRHFQFWLAVLVLCLVPGTALSCASKPREASINPDMLTSASMTILVPKLPSGFNEVNNQAFAADVSRPNDHNAVVILYKNGSESVSFSFYIWGERSLDEFSELSKTFHTIAARESSSLGIPCSGEMPRLQTPPPCHYKEIDALDVGFKSEAFQHESNGQSSESLDIAERSGIVFAMLIQGPENSLLRGLRVDLFKSIDDSIQRLATESN